MPTQISFRGRLMWAMKVTGSSMTFDGQGVGDCLHCADDTYDWNTAMSEWISNVNGLEFSVTGQTQSGLGGYTDWRMPTQIELLSIVDMNEGECAGPTVACPPTCVPCINPLFGPSVTQGEDSDPDIIMWSSTTHDTLADRGFAVNFIGPAEYVRLKSQSHFVRAVRNIR